MAKLIELRDVYKIYGEGLESEVRALDGVSLDIEKGEFVAVVGQSGAGKPTMVNLLMRFYEISGGTISIDGIDTKSVPRWNVHDQFSMVLQDTWVFRGTVRENIAYSKKDVTDEQIVAACKAVGLHHYIMSLPNGYDTVLDDKASLAGMTDVYDAAIDASLTWAIRHQTQEMGLDEAPAAIAVIGMGRYGGREVNFSSDADVIIIYRPSDNADDNQANLFARKVQEDLRAILQGPTTLEPKIELDMDLRPEGKNGPLVRSYASCEEYYRSWASTWEHQALLRARYAAGDAALAEDFLMNVADPLRYPKIDLTEAQVAEIRKLKARMEAERLPRGVRRDRHLKLGKGGLSDVEWTIQLLQLQHAGDNANLRVNGTMQALDELERRKLVSAGDAVVLRRAWWMCTAARNGSYLWSGRVNQADILPDDTYSLGGLAVYLGYDANRGQHFENDLLAVMRKARDVTERLFYGLS